MTTQNLKSDEVARNEPARKPSTAAPAFKTATFEAKEPVTADSPPIKMLRIPKDVTVFTVSVCLQRKSNARLALQVGDDDDPGRYVARTLVGRGARLDATGSGSICDYPEPATIDVTVVDGELQPGDMLRAVVGYASA